jgi:hypothetical protein
MGSDLFLPQALNHKDTTLRAKYEFPPLQNMYFIIQNVSGIRNYDVILPQFKLPPLATQFLVYVWAVIRF